MLFKRALLPMMILASLTGCGPAALDGSTPDTLDESIAKVANKLPEAQRAQFGEDITLIKSYYGKENPDQLLPNLNGKNAADIAAEAANLREEQRIQQEKLAVEEQQRAYLAELQKKKTSLEEAIKPLQDSQKQSLERSEFKVESGKLGQMQNKATGALVNGIELVLKNGTTEEIYAAMFNGSLAEHGAQKPVLTSGFDVSFESPLQPGETRTVLFIPAMVSDWREVVIPEGAEFSVQLDELLNIANKPLFSKGEFTLEDQVTLDKLVSDLKAVNSELGIADGGDTVVPQGPAPGADTPFASSQEPSETTALLPEQSEDATAGTDTSIHPEAGTPAAPGTEPALTDSAPIPDAGPTAEESGASTSTPSETAVNDDAPIATESSGDQVDDKSTLAEPSVDPAPPAVEASADDGTLPSVGEHDVPVTPLKSS